MTVNFGVDCGTTSTTMLQLPASVNIAKPLVWNGKVVALNINPTDPFIDSVDYSFMALALLPAANISIVFSKLRQRSFSTILIHLFEHVQQSGWATTNGFHHRGLLSRLLHSNQQCGQSTTTSFCQASLPRCASTEAQLIWALGICCCWPNCMELIEPLRLALTVSDVCLKFGCFQYSALELSHFVCYINSWLTYLLIRWVINNEANETHGDAYAVIRYFLMWRMWWQKVKIGTYTIGIK